MKYAVLALVLVVVLGGVYLATKKTDESTITGVSLTGSGDILPAEILPIAKRLLSLETKTAGGMAVADKGTDPAHYFDGGVVVGQDGIDHLDIFDELDYEVFTNQEWVRFHESHADNIVVTWPDGHETYGLDQHINDLKGLFVHAPDTHIKYHPIKIAAGDWTAVYGVMEGTFTEPMPLPDGTEIPPTGNSFALPMATFGYWKDGVMVQEWLLWDNQTYMSQLGIGG